MLQRRIVLEGRWGYRLYEMTSQEQLVEMVCLSLEYLALDAHVCEV